MFLLHGKLINIRLFFGLLPAILLTNVVAYAQTPAITKIEYFIDTDPGYNNATNLSFTGTTNATGTIAINLLPLSEGVHIVGVRSRDANGAWSADNQWLFVKPYATVATAQPVVNRVEWWMDNDPGYGNATSLAITPAQNLSGLAFNIDLLSLAQGVHIVGVRSRDANGAWSLDNKWLFVKPYTTLASQQPIINRVEYWLDNDPGYGNATPLSITPATQLANLSFNISLAGLRSGIHVMGVRSRDANGAWSLDNKWIFLKPDSIANGANPSIVRMEYYIDRDPGYGRATSINITPGSNINMQIVDADISVVANGTHKLGIRSMDANGAWSLDNKVDFTGGTANSWIGVTSTAWNTASNWSKGTVPVVTDGVVIPAGTPFSPLIANNITGNCKSIIVSPAAVITIANGGKLLVGN